MGNCTSLNSQLEAVLHLDADILGLSEVRLTAAGQRQHEALLEQRGYRVAWGAPCRRKRFGSKVQHGGVAVLTRAHINVRAVVPDAKKQPEAFRCWEEGRLMHAVIPVGRQTVHVVVVYGHPNSATDIHQRVKNEALLASAMALMAQLGRVPVFFGGDLNTTIEASGELTAALRLGNFLDLAELQEGGAAPTCFPRNTSVGTRIDHLFANVLASTLVTQSRQMKESALPTHVPLQCEINLNLVSQQGFRFRTPRMLPLDWGEPDEEQETVAAEAAMGPILAASQAMWDMQLHYGDLDGAYELLSAAAEQYSGIRAGVPLQRSMCGRGKGVLQKHTTSTQTSDDFGAVTSKLQRTQQLLRRCEELHRKLHLRGQEEMQSQEAANLWSNIREDVVSLLPEAMDALQLSMPSLQVLGEMCVKCRNRASQMQDENRTQRAKDWQHWTRQEWSHNKGHIFSMCKDEESKPLAVLQRPDGTLTGEASEMDQLLRQYWLDIFQLYTCLPCPSWESFRAKYGQYIPQGYHMSREALTPQGLREVLKKMNPSTSIGADGWKVVELRKMPDCWLSWLCTLFHRIEELGRWPTALAHGLIAPLPKEEGFQAKDIRPITIMSVVYRLWAGARVRELLERQEELGREQLAQLQTATRLRRSMV